MTIQLASEAFGASKKALQNALDTQAGRVFFHNPSAFSTGPSDYSAEEIPACTKFPVVLDPRTRRRFATVERKRDGSFKVS